MDTRQICKLTVLPLLLSLVACGGGGSNPTGITPLNCTIEGQNQFVYDVMQDLYLYQDQLPTVNPTDYASPSALLEDMLVSPDRFSSISDQQTLQNFFEEGTFNGIGFSFINNDEFYTVTSIFDDSSAGREGLKRGDNIHSIEDISVTQINADGGISKFLSNYTDNESLTFSISSAGAPATNKEMSKGLVKMNTVLSAEVITSNSLNIGYLALTSFITPTKAELDTAFKKFKQENIDELVLDLRYNGGGRIDTAQLLASYIAGNAGFGAATTKLIYNEKNSDQNESFPFQTLEDAVDLTRLYVLTLNGTCSASELVINAMGPVGIDVVTIGQTTCGKPVGFRNINFCDKTLSPVSFSIVNDSNEGDYFDGISATCSANDDTSAMLGDVNEDMFAAALFHINSGQCPVAAKPPLQKPSKAGKELKNRGDIMRTVY